MSSATGSSGRPSKPQTPSVDFEAIPSKLQNRTQWLLWRYKWKGDKWAKVPVNPDSGRIDSATDPEVWSSFEGVQEAYRSDYIQSDGIGFAFSETDMVVGIDLDDCRNPETGEPTAEARELIERLDSWTEVSPSGTGYHVFVIGAIGADGTRGDMHSKGSHLEMYDQKRFFTVTGNHVSETPQTVETRPTVVSDLHTEYVATPTEDTQNVPATPVGSGGSTPTDLEDSELIEKAKNSKNGDEFRRLWNGDTSQYGGDHSRADLALCSYLAFWTGGDKHRVDSLFRQSDLMRDKWDEQRGSQTYGEMTVKKAIRDTSETYDPKGSTGKQHPSDTDSSAVDSPSAFEVVNGGYSKWHPPRGDDTEGYYERITNFQIETLSRLTHEDGTREYHLRINPADGEPYDQTCEPVVFNDLRKFRREVLDGWTATFDGNQEHLNRLKEFVGNQEAKDRTGTRLLGLHGDEWVTPDGSLTAEGWSDDPKTVFTDVDTPLATAFNVRPSDGAQYDREGVGEILRLLPQTRTPERFLPVLGWFYAAPFRPYIQQWEGEFNILNVLGDTGSGKTTTLETLWRAFGVNEELPEAKATPFSIMRMMASSNALPVILDEYKPVEIRDYKLNELHSNLRASTRGGIVTKGRADMGVDKYHLKAPVCISGEQPIEGPAEERRTILTVFKRDVTVGETDEQEAFAQLVGGEANGEWYDGHDLTDHAKAYYQWVLQQDESELHDLWEEARQRVLDIVDSGDFGSLDDMVIQGFQTIKFGTTLYRAFASDMGVDTDTLTVTTDRVNQAIRYVATSGTGAEHSSHLDRLIGVLTRAASAGYVTDGDHYTVVNAGQPNAELAIHLSTAFDKVRKYARDHDVRSDDLLSSAGDYKARIKDAADDTESYVTSHSQKSPPLNRCVRINIGDATELVDGFEPAAFGVTDTQPRDETPSSRFDPVSLLDVATDPTGYPTVRGEIATVDYPEGDNSPAVKATLRANSTIIDVISWDDRDCLKCDGEVIIENAATSKFDGTTQLVIKDGVTVVHQAPDDSQRQIDDPETVSTGSDSDSEGGELTR